MAQSRKHTALHLVQRALPDLSGYTLRSHRLARALVRDARCPVDVLVAGDCRFRSTIRRTASGLSLCVHDGVRYWRLSKTHLVSRIYCALSRLARNASLPGAWRFGSAERFDGSAVAEACRRYSQTRNEFDLVHAHTPPELALGAARLASHRQVPLLFEVRGFWDLTHEALCSTPDHQDWIRNYRTHEKEACDRADIVVTLSNSMRQELIARGIDSQKIRILPNGVDATLCVPRGDKDRRLARRLEIDGRFVCGYVSSIRRLEGIDTLIDAIGILRRAGRSVVMVLVGAGPDLERLREYAKARGVDAACRFVGRVAPQHVLRYYSLFDAFVVPRVDLAVCRTVTPLKPLEAMARGIPVIVSRLPALLEVTNARECAWTFEPENPEHLALQIETIMDSHEVATKRARVAAEWVRTNRSWGAIAMACSSLYTELCSH